MPIYRVTIHKEMDAAPSVKWTNVYNVNTFDVFAAESVASTIAAIEQAVHYDIVDFVRADVVNVANKLDRRTVALSLNGNLHHDTVGVQLPLFCATLVTFTDLVKKPEQKYIRAPGWSDRITAGASWDNAWILNFHNNYMNPLLELAEYCGPSGERPAEATVHSPIQNRQTGWHRRTRVGFKRGWVPV